MKALNEILKILRGKTMKTTLKTIALLLVIITVISCLFGCGIQKPYNEILGSDISEDLGSEIVTDSPHTDEKNTEKNKYTTATSSNKSDSSKEDVIVTTTPDGGKEVMVKSDSKLTPLTVSSNSIAAYEIVSHYSLSLAPMKTFISDLKAKTGADFNANVKSQVPSIGGKQIVVGAFSDFINNNYKGAPEFKSWTGSAVAVSGETIYIGVIDSGLLGNILTSFVSKIKAVGSNKYVVAADLKFAYDKCAVSEYIPPITLSSSTGVTNKGIYSAGGGNYQITYTGIKAADVSNYCSTLISKGFTLQQQNTINTNNFYLYVKGDTIVHVNWFAKLNQFSVVYGPKTYVPAKKPITGYSKKVTPTITMLALGEIGTSIVIQLEDGSFLLIDGGLGNTTYNKDSTTLWNFLSSKAPAGEKPRITWLVTHIHTDHRALFQKFIPSYKNKIELELVAWNMPDFKEIANKYSPNWNEKNPAANYATPVATITNIVKNNFPKAPIYTFHTGEKLYLPGCEIEFLACHEDYYLNKFRWINDTSITCRLTMQGKTMMIFGDTTNRVSNAIITPAYGNYIKSDILQVAHHGNGEGTLATYKAVAADICLWSATNSDYNTYIKQNDQNKWLYSSTTKHYNHSSTVTITIPSMAVKQTKVYS